MTQAPKTAHQPFEMQPTADGVVGGPIRSPRNIEQSLPNSIHNDAVAQKLGLRGGTVAGSLHMEQFPPLLISEFGSQWWSEGGLSLYFKYATTDREPVQCFAAHSDRRKDGEQQRVWMDTEDGRRVAEGTAWVGRNRAHAVGGADCQRADAAGSADFPGFWLGPGDGGHPGARGGRGPCASSRRDRGAP